MLHEAHDIDWFFLDKNDKIGFVASGGGIIPKSFVEYDIGIYFRKLPNTTEDFEISKDVPKIFGIKSIELLEKEIFDFTSMAKKGLYCYDKMVLNDYSNTKYHLIVKPKIELKLNNLPENIQKILRKTVLNLDITKVNDIDTLDFK